MKKTINFCGNCPFLHTNYYFQNYDKPSYDCSLLMFLQVEFEEQILDPYDEFNVIESCPLKTEEFNFNFNSFSNDRLDDINNVKNQIIEIEKFFNENDYDADNDDHVKLNIKLSTLYDKLDELHNNEEKTFDFQKDLNANINKIKEQLELLSDVGNKINQTINDLNNDKDKL
jgi:hypothetical protein